MGKHRPIHNGDIVKYLQENQALLKTLLWRQEQATANPEQAQIENVEKYRQFLSDAELTFDHNTKLPD